MPDSNAQAAILGSEVEVGNVLFILFIPSKDKNGMALKAAVRIRFPTFLDRGVFSGTGAAGDGRWT